MQNIHNLIESYFDCTLSEQEERELKVLLATTTEDSEDIREAKAVLGVFAMERTSESPGIREPGYPRPRKPGIPRLRYPENPVSRNLEASKSRRLEISKSRLLKYSAAAAIALLLGFTGANYIANYQTDICVMYAEGQTIKNEEAIFAQMASELNAIGDAAESADNTMSSQLSEMAIVID